MKKKTLDRIAIGVFVLLIAGSLLVNFNVSNEEIIEEDGLEWYRSEDLPKDCQLPEYETNLEEWKKSLRHEKETWYCLKYFE